MKKLFLLFFVSSILWSCDQTDENAVPESGVPPEVAQTITKLFNGAETNFTITTIKPNELFAAELLVNQVKYQILIDGQGNVKKLGTATSPASLTEPIQVFLDKNYPNATIQEVFDVQEGVQEPVSEYVVIIDGAIGSSYVQMSFDTLGGLNSSIGIGSELFEGLVMNLDKFTDLPQSVQLFLSKQHPGFDFLFASFLSPSNGAAYYHVAIKIGDKQHEYKFSSSGQLLKTYEPADFIANLVATSTSSSSGSMSNIPVSSDLPAKIVNYLNANFSGWQFLNGIKELDDVNQALKSYIISIKVGSNVYYVYFDAEATFLGAKKDK